MTRINKDQNRTATLWLKNDSFLEIPEDMWPSYTRHEDRTAAARWHEITGLMVTIETVTKTTVDTR
jgi:hypothetical protein